MTYVSGDFWRICDECGFKTRSSETRKRWDGLIVCLSDFEQRHPQDFVRGRKDRQNVPDPRPEPADVLTGALQTVTTTAALPGSSTLVVASTVRFVATNRIGVTLVDGTLYRATVNTVPDLVSMTLTVPLPAGVPIGAVIINYSAVTTPDLG